MFAGKYEVYAKNEKFKSNFKRGYINLSNIKVNKMFEIK